MFELRSSAFEDGARIPDIYANTGVTRGNNISIPFVWHDAPEGTKSLALIIVDRHRVAHDFVHWLVTNIPPDTTSIPEGASGTSKMPPVSSELRNTAGSRGYSGPRPPAGSGDHDYEATIYALRKERIDLVEVSSADLFTTAIRGDILDSSKLIGLFSR